MSSQSVPTPLRIALAEDEADLRRAFVRLLERLGHQVVCSAANGAELVDACRDLEVDIVFVDLDMPVMDGLQAAEMLAERNIPVVLVSGHPDVREMVPESEPVAARILKPATIESFSQAIAEALPGRG